MTQIEFCRAQIEYYKSMWNRGNPRDWHMIIGLQQEYERELAKLLREEGN